MKKKHFEYNGYYGTVDFDLEAKELFGKVKFVKDTIIYQGEDLEELESSFKDALDEYIETCEEIGKAPDKPFSGTFNVRIDPELHKNLAYKVEEKGLKSLNVGVSEAIENWVRSDDSQREITHNHNISVRIENVIDSNPEVEFKEYGVQACIKPNLSLVN